MIEVKKQIVINAPVAEVWRVLADEYHRVGEWASSIDHSAINHEAPVPDGLEYGGRICSVPGFGDLKESFTNYDADNLTYSYEATDGMPFFVTKAGNTWSLSKKGEKTVVDMHLIADVNLFPGKLMQAMMKRQFDRQAGEVIEELKYFVEQGKPHPRKVKAMQKSA